MTNYLALDWEDDRLSGVDADVSGNRVRVLSTFQLQWPEDAAPQHDPVRAGEWLKSELQRLAVSGQQCLVSLPREGAVVRQLELPNVPDDELPDIVRMQAATQSTLSMDQFLLDYLPLPKSSGDGRRALMATIPTDVSNRIRRVAEAAELELQSITISPVATAELVARTEKKLGQSAAGVGLLVARHGQRVEISLQRGSHLLFSHSTQVHGEVEDDDNRAVVAEINRTRYSLGDLLEGDDITRAWVIGSADETRALAGALGERITQNVSTLDPLEAVEFDSAGSVSAGGAAAGHHAVFAAPVGMLQGLNSPLVEPVDFINPRRVVQKLDKRKLQIWVGSAAAGLAAVGGLVAHQMHLGKLDSKISSRNSEVRELEQAYKAGESEVDAHEQLDDWHKHSVDWLAEIQRLNTILPGTERVLLTEYRLDSGTGDSRGFIRADGFARSRRDAEDVNQTLDAAGYTVHPTELKPRRDSRYSHSLPLDLSIPIDREDDSADGEDKSNAKETAGGDQADDTAKSENVTRRRAADEPSAHGRSDNEVTS